MSQELTETTEEISDQTDQTEQTEETPVQTPEQVQEELDGRFAAMRRYERELKSRAKELDSQAAQLKAQLQEYEDLSGDFRTKPEQAWERLAAKAGLTPDEYLERVVERRVSGKPSEKELWEEIQLLKKELSDKEAKKAQEAEQYALQVQEQQEMRAVTHATQDWCQILQSEEGAAKFEHLSGLKPEAMEARVASAMMWALRNPTVPLEDIIRTIDKMVEEEYAPREERLKARLLNQDQEYPVKTPAEPRASGDNPTTTRSKTISNTTQSVRSGVRKPMTRDERIAAAARAVPSR